MNKFSRGTERSDDRRNFVVATPFRTVCDDNARALERQNLLRFIALGTRRGAAGIPPERTRLKPAVGLISYIAARSLSVFAAESLRFRLHPWFDHWVKKQLRPGDHIISSYGYANASFRWVRQHGGCTFLDGGNSHPKFFWEILSDEHQRWGCRRPPVAEHHHRRSIEMLTDVDYVLSPSEFVTRSFLERGFRPDQILRNVYPLDLSLFTPSDEPRPHDRPLTVICTGSLSLRKGTPYLLEAFRMVRQKEPSARLLLTQSIEDSVRPIMAKYSDLPIEWAPALPHRALRERLRSADVFVLPSLEDGFARTVTEALACGLPAIVTQNTGASDLVRTGVNGAVVPIRDSAALSQAILEWGNRMRSLTGPRITMVDPSLLSFDTFERCFLDQLRERKIIQ